VPFGSSFQAGSYLHVRTRAASAGAEQALLSGLRQMLLEVDP